MTNMINFLYYNYILFVLYIVIICNFFQTIFSQANINIMQTLGAGDVLLGLALSIPTVARYKIKYTEAITNNKGLSMPSTHSDALALKSR